MREISKEWIDEMVVEIMVKEGPDKHCDGHETITDFIMSLKNGTEKEWADKYRNKE